MNIFEKLKSLDLIDSEPVGESVSFDLNAAIANHVPRGKIAQQISRKLSHDADLSSLVIGEQQSLVFWSRKEIRQCVAIFSSRLGRRVRQNQSWLRTLMALLRVEIEPGQILISARGMTCHRFVERVAESQGQRMVEVTLTKKSKHNWQRWLDNIVNNRSVDGIFVSPFIGGEGREIGRDRIVAELASKLLVFGCNAGGNIEGTMTEMLKRDSMETRAKKCIVVVGVTDRESEMLSAASRQWFAVDRPKANEYNFSENAESKVTSTGQLIFLDDLSSVKPLLSHWTRGVLGPWPDQTEQQYLDELLWAANLERDDEMNGLPQSSSAQSSLPQSSSALSSLTRILRQRCLLGSGATIRGAEKVVCLTSIPLEQFPQRRVFRRHRGHWDFEPYGIAFSAEVLNGLAEPVIYGHDDTWNKLRSSQRWRFQSSETVGGEIDWKKEEEWRVDGDLAFGDWKDGVYPFVLGRSDVPIVRKVWDGPIIVLEKERFRQAGQ